MLQYLLAHAPHTKHGHRVEYTSTVLEDNITLFGRQVFKEKAMDIYWPPLAEFVSFFAVQPRKDFKNAARTLSLINNQEGVRLVYEVFTAHSSKVKKKEEEGHTALLLLAVVSVEFSIKSEPLLPVLVQTLFNVDVYSVVRLIVIS